MAKNKLKRFAENREMPNVLEPPIEEVLKGINGFAGKWADRLGNDNPITLELACGKGEYTVGMARLFPNRNFIGVDIKGSRMWRGAKTCIEEGLTNAAFLRTRIDFIDRFFEPEEVSDIWITFPDPQLKKNRIRKRLTHPIFLDRYKKILKKGGTVNLKTDSTSLFDFTLDVVNDQSLIIHNQTLDIYRLGRQKFDHDLIEVLEIKTFYEQMWLEEAKTIKFIQFSFE